MLVTICIVVFFSECAMQTVKNLSILTLTKLKQASLKLLWTIVGFTKIIILKNHEKKWNGFYYNEKSLV
jgi:hypothetical protein